MMACVRSHTQGHGPPQLMTCFNVQIACCCCRALLQVVVLPAPPAFDNTTNTDKACKSEVACSAADVSCRSTALDCHHSSSSQEGPSNVNATCGSPLVAFMPRLQPASLLQPNSDGETGTPNHGRARVELLSPQPGAILEADRVQQFVVVAPAAAAVAVGSEQSGWTVLQPRQANESGAPAGCGGGGGGDGSGLNPCTGVFEGHVMLPRVSTCFIAVQEQLAEQGHTWQAREAGSSAGSAPEGACHSNSWVPLLGLHVWPPVSAGEPCVRLCVGWDGLSTQPSKHRWH